MGTELCTDNHKTCVCDQTLQHFTQSSSPRRIAYDFTRLLWKWRRGIWNLRVYKNFRIINLESIAVVNTLRWVQHEIQAESPPLKVVNPFIIVTPFCTFKCHPLAVPPSLWSLSFSGFDKSLTIFSSVSLIKV